MFLIHSHFYLLQFRLSWTVRDLSPLYVKVYLGEARLWKLFGYSLLFAIHPESHSALKSKKMKREKFNMGNVFGMNRRRDDGRDQLTQMETGY